MEKLRISLDLGMPTIHIQKNMVLEITEEPVDRLREKQ